MPFNKIITPLVSIQNTPSGGKPNVTINLEILSSLLIQECSTEIHIVPFNQEEKDLVRTELEKLPAFFQNRIKIGDQDFSIKNKLEKFLEPTFEIGNVKQSGEGQKKSPYSDAYLTTALRVLQLACKINAEADIPFMSTINNRLQWSKKICINSEGQARLDSLIGIFNCYETSSNASFRVNPVDYKSLKISQRLDELLVEPDLQELSEVRYSLGIPAMLKKLPEIKKVLFQKSKKLMQNNKFTKILSHSPQVTALAVSGGTVPVPAIPIPDWEKYNPPIVDLIEIRKKILEEIPNLGSHIFLMADSPLHSTSAPGSPGAPTFMLPGTLRFDGTTSVAIDLQPHLNSKKPEKKSQDYDKRKENE